jgi:hypothetical protein
LKYIFYYIFLYSGASAGAGSGEFDIYRGCRRRQIIREAFLNREAKEVCLNNLITKAEIARRV